MDLVKWPGSFFSRQLINQEKVYIGTPIFVVPVTDSRSPQSCLERERERNTSKVDRKDGNDREKVKNVVGSQMLNWQSRNSATLNLFLTLLQEQLVNLVVRFSFSCIGNVFAFFLKKRIWLLEEKKNQRYSALRMLTLFSLTALTFRRTLLADLKEKAKS
jgi:hypothetical protein